MLGGRSRKACCHDCVTVSAYGLLLRRIPITARTASSRHGRMVTCTGIVHTVDCCVLTGCCTSACISTATNAGLDMPLVADTSVGTPRGRIAVRRVCSFVVGSMGRTVRRKLPRRSEAIVRPGLKTTCTFLTQICLRVTGCRRTLGCTSVTLRRGSALCS